MEDEVIIEATEEIADWTAAHLFVKNGILYLAAGLGEDDPDGDCVSANTGCCAWHWD